jgi:putative glutamine amidotransferase
MTGVAHPHPQPSDLATRHSSTPRKPLVGISAWRRTLTTGIGEAELVTLGLDYVIALQDAGAIVVVLPAGDPDDTSRVLDSLDGLVLSGGSDLHPSCSRLPATPGEAYEPDRDATEAALLLGARARRLPTLAICRGLQLTVATFGGELVHDLPVTPSHPADRMSRAALAHRHTVELFSGSWLSHTLRAAEVAVNSLHHQAPARLPADLTCVATAPDGVIEAAESTDPDWFFVGVQWHPEKMTDPADGDHCARLLSAFLDVCRAPAPTSARPLDPAHR